MQDYEQTIFISYAWGGEREEIEAAYRQAFEFVKLHLERR